MVFPPLDAAARQRMKRFLGVLAVLWYTRTTAQSLHENHVQLRLQKAFQRGDQGVRSTLATRALRYTFWGQLIASMEYLIPLVKPVLALRIGRLLVWKGHNVVANQAYGPHARNTLDLYGVEPPTSSKPVIVFVHGGAWSFGHKWQYGLVGQHLAEYGFLVGVINYRTYPTGNVLNQAEDVERATQWIIAHAEQYGGDPRRVFLSGHSSGAHVSALALAQSAKRAIDSPRGDYLHQQVRGLIGLAGPFDIADHYEFEANRKVGPIDGVHEISSMKPAMLGEDKFDESSPTKLFQSISARDVTLPRFHLLHGTGDEVVPISSSIKLADSLRQAGHDAEYIELAGCTHEDILFAAMGDSVPSKREVVNHYKRIVYEDGSVSVAPATSSLQAKL